MLDCGCACSYGGFCGGCGHRSCGLRAGQHRAGNLAEVVDLTQRRQRLNAQVSGYPEPMATTSGSASADDKNATTNDPAVGALTEVADQLKQNAAEGEGQQMSEAHQARRGGLRDAIALIEQKIEALLGKKPTNG